MKRKMFLLGSLALMVAGSIFWSCQKDELMDTEDVMLKKGKVSTMETVDALTWEGEVCAGTSHDLTLDFPDQGLNNGGQQLLTNVQVQIYDADLNIYIQIFAGNFISTQTFSYLFPEAGEYDLRYKIGGGGFTDIVVNVVNCLECEESFSYIDNEDGTYTFTYVPAEDIDDATLVFTFAQGVAVDGDLAEWESKGVTKQKVMDLLACQEYEWTVTLSARCGGGGQSEVNAWTDFKVGHEWVYDEEKEKDVLIEISKKGILSNIRVHCTE